NLTNIIGRAKENGGMTVDTNGNYITSGIAYAPNKDSETILGELDYEGLSNFVAANWDSLQEDGNYIGGWFNEDDSKWYLDVSRVGGYNTNTIKEAQDNEQLAVFDLDKFEEITIGEIKDGKYKAIDTPEAIFGKAF